MKQPSYQESESIGHQWLKSMAREMGRPVTGLLAMARQNDPFFVGGTASRGQAEWFAEVWERAGYTRGVHLRRVHYLAVRQAELPLPNGVLYANTEGCWQYLCQSAKHARYLGLVAIGDIQDNKNPSPHLHATPQTAPNARYWVHLPELAEPGIYINEGDGFNLAKAQPYHLEVWCEKSTMDDVLLPLGKQYFANVATFAGEATLTACHSLVERIISAGKPARVFYISDHDPAGRSMPCAVSRKIEYLLRAGYSDLDVRLHRLALNPEQIEAYNLPRVPVKETERRAAQFETNHGAGAVELDALEALHPGELRRIVDDALAHHFDHGADAAAREKERSLRRAIRERVSAITARYSAEIEALASMRHEIEDIEVTGDYEPDDPQPLAGDSRFTWLFDSRRSYLDQIQEYKAYQRGEA